MAHGGFSAFTLEPLGSAASGVITALTYCELSPPKSSPAGTLWFNVYCGTADGKLDMFKVRSSLGAGDVRVMDSCTTEQSGKVVSRRRKPVLQLQAIDHCGHLIVLCGDKLGLYDLATLAEAPRGGAKALQRIGATSLFCCELGGPPLFRLAAATKRKLTLFEFSRGEYMVKKEIATAHRARQMVWHDEHIFVAYANEYVMVNATSGELESIPIALSDAVRPIVTLTPDEEYLVTGPSNIGIRLQKSCHLANKGAIPWSESPSALGCSFPYIVALLGGTKQLAVYFDEESGGQSRLVQTIALDWEGSAGAKAEPLLVDGSASAGADDLRLEIMMGSTGRGAGQSAVRRARVLADPRRPVLAARGNGVAWLLPTPFAKQIVTLIDSLLIDQAVDLCKCISGSDTRERRDRRFSSFHARAATALFRAARVSDAVAQWKAALGFQSAVLAAEEGASAAAGAGGRPLRARARSDAGEFPFEPFDLRELIAFFPEAMPRSALGFRPAVLTPSALGVASPASGAALTIAKLLKARRSEGAALEEGDDAALAQRARAALCELLTWAVAKGLRTLLPAPLPSRFTEVVQSALLLAHVKVGRLAELRALLDAPGSTLARDCALEECVGVLEAKALHHLAALLLRRHGSVVTRGRALEIWRRIASGELVDGSVCFVPGDAGAATIALLAEVEGAGEEEELVWRYAAWVVRTRPEAAMEIFVSERREAGGATRPLPPLRVLELLRASLKGSALRSATTRFLDWCVRGSVGDAALRRTLRTELAIDLVQARLHGEDEVVGRLVEGSGAGAATEAGSRLSARAQRASEAVAQREARARSRAYVFDFLAEDGSDLDAGRVLAVIEAHFAVGAEGGGVGDDAETLLAERVELLGRCAPPRHEAALRILVYETNDFAMVERYCVQAEARCAERRQERRRRDSFRSEREAETMSSGNAFLVLLRMLFAVEGSATDGAAERGAKQRGAATAAPPPLPRMLSSSRALVERALELLVRHSAAIDPLDVLAVLPDDFALCVVLARARAASLSGKVQQSTLTPPPRPPSLSLSPPPQRPARAVL